MRFQWGLLWFSDFSLHFLQRCFFSTHSCGTDVGCFRNGLPSDQITVIVLHETIEQFHFLMSARAICTVPRGYLGYHICLLSLYLWRWKIGSKKYFFSTCFPDEILPSLFDIVLWFRLSDLKNWWWERGRFGIAHSPEHESVSPCWQNSTAQAEHQPDRT